MSGAKHTPGPWVQKRSLVSTTVNIETPAGLVIAEVGDTSTEDAANANLIATAPLLLEALCDLLKHAERANEIMLHEAGMGVCDITAIARARCVIAAARGEA